MNVVDAKAVPAGGHGREKLAELAGEFGGRGSVEFNHLAEEMVRQQADAVGKEAKEQAHEEVGGALGIDPALAKAGSELGRIPPPPIP